MINKAQRVQELRILVHCQRYDLSVCCAACRRCGYLNIRIRSWRRSPAATATAATAATATTATQSSASDKQH